MVISVHVVQLLAVPAVHSEQLGSQRLHLFVVISAHCPAGHESVQVVPIKKKPA